MEKLNHKRKKILIVDENPEVLSFLKEETDKIGAKFQFEKVDSFTQAVDSMVSGGYDLVILDFPGIRGPYLLNLAFLREIPVLILISFTFFPLEAEHLMEKGVAGLLFKENLTEIIPALNKIFISKQALIPPEGLMKKMSEIMM
jgi:CheY-like chemotaxis protein